MSDNTSVILDLGRTCRICLAEKSTEELRSLLEDNLSKILCEIANIQLEFHSPLPTNICTDCLKTLNTVINFRNQIEESETQLRNLNLIYSVIDQSDQHVTVIYKSFAVLETGDAAEECKENKEIDIKGKNNQSEKIFVVEHNDTEQGCSWVSSKNGEKKVLRNILKSDTDIYEVIQDVDNSSHPEDNFGSDDERKSREPENLSKNAFFINGNLSNVIKWADSENNSISLSMENNRNERPKADNTEQINKKSEHVKTEDRNVKVATKQSGEKDKKATSFSCCLCAKKFRYDFGYRAHLLKHGVSIVCKICPESFNDIKTYLLHTKSDHPDFKPFSCPNCDKSFAVMSTLKNHYRCHATNHKPRKFACDICGRKFSQHNFMVAHKKSHSGNNQYQCDICKKTFAGNHSLRNHLKIHRGEKKHVCNICEARFIHRFSLRAHLRTHSGEKPFACNLCNNKFSTSSYLKIHMRSHTSEKPYTCSYCLKKFVSRCGLAAHEKSHTGEKKFQCDTCGWRSTRMADLQTHIRSHTGERPYACDQCDRRYKTASNLAFHKKTHSGLREHVCTICTKAFGDPRTLKSHIRVHTGETPYQCHICGNRYKQSGQLSAHRKIHQQ